MNFRRLKKDNIVIFVAIFLIAVYIFYQCYSVTHIELKTETALITTEYDSVDATALIVREESLISSASDVTVPCLKDGDKVNSGGNIAMTFTSTDAAASYSKFNEINEELEYYENLKAQTIGQTASLDSIDKGIEDSVDDYIRAMANGNVELLNDKASTVNEGLFRRQTIIGTKVNIDDSIAQLRKKAAEYSSNAKPTGFVTTDKSGIFSSYIDGYENEFDYSKVKDMTVKDVQAAIEKASAPKGDNSKSIGKLITSYSWYFVCVVNSDDLKAIQKNKTVDVMLKSNDDIVIKAKVISDNSGAVPNDDGNAVLVLQCNYINDEIAGARLEDIEIRNNVHTGIKAPATAVHVVDGKKGVYVLISSQVRFREADIVFSKNGYVLLSYNDDNPKGIRIYDKIITQGKDLEDGKVYT